MPNTKRTIYYESIRLAIYLKLLSALLFCGEKLDDSLEFYIFGNYCGYYGSLVVITSLCSIVSGNDDVISCIRSRTTTFIVKQAFIETVECSPGS